MMSWRLWNRRKQPSSRGTDRPADPLGSAGCVLPADMVGRGRLFDALMHDNQGLFYTENSPERFVVNCRDHYISRTLFVNGIDACEFSKFALVQEILQRSGPFPRVFDTLVDVGANIGVICIPAVARGYCRKAVAIEPHPENCRILRANISLNGLHEKIVVHEAAASTHDDALLELAISPTNAGDHRIIASTSPGRYGEQTWATMRVPSMRLDSLEADLRSGSCLIWMDIQGCEGFALAGATNLLGHRPPLVLEFWPYGMARSNSFAAMLQAVSGYENFHVVEENARAQAISDLPSLWDRVGSAGAFVDILVT